MITRNEIVYDILEHVRNNIKDNITLASLSFLSILYTPIYILLDILLGLVTLHLFPNLQPLYTL